MNSCTRTILSRVSAHTRTSAHPQFWQFCGFQGPPCSRHIENSKVGPLSSHSCDYSDALWAPQHHAGIKDLHTPVRGLKLFTAFFPCSMKFVHCKWRLNAAETWQRGYKSVHIVAQYSFLHYRAGLDEAQTKWRCKLIRYPLVANFASRVGPCMGELNHLSTSSVQPRTLFLMLELQAPTGTCPEHYGLVR